MTHSSLWTNPLMVGIVYPLIVAAVVGSWAMLRRRVSTRAKPIAEDIEAERPRLRYFFY